MGRLNLGVITLTQDVAILTVKPNTQPKSNFNYFLMVSWYSVQYIVHKRSKYSLLADIWVVSEFKSLCSYIDKVPLESLYEHLTHL